MAIYNPPKEKNWGSVLQAAGTTVSAVGGIVAASGAGIVPGAIAAGIGGIMTGIGAIGNKQQQIKLQEYDTHYKARVHSDNALQSSISNIKQMANINL